MRFFLLFLVAMAFAVFAASEQDPTASSSADGPVKSYMCTMAHCEYSKSPPFRRRTPDELKRDDAPPSSFDEVPIEAKGGGHGGGHGGKSGHKSGAGRGTVSSANSKSVYNPVSKLHGTIIMLKSVLTNRVHASLRDSVPSARRPSFVGKAR